MRRLLALISLCLLALLLIAPVQGQDGIADWTYMQYFAMDNNLESALYNDLTELQAVGSTDQVNIVAQVDRIPGYETRFGDWTDTRRFLLQHQEQPQLTQDQKIEEILMLVYAQPNTDPEDLRQQLRQIHDTDPAAYASLISDAGFNPDNTALIDKIISSRGLGLQFDTAPVEDMGELDMGDSADPRRFRHVGNRELSGAALRADDQFARRGLDRQRSRRNRQQRSASTAGDHSGAPASSGSDRRRSA